MFCIDSRIFLGKGKAATWQRTKDLGIRNCQCAIKRGKNGVIMATIDTKLNLSVCDTACCRGKRKIDDILTVLTFLHFVPIRFWRGTQEVSALSRELNYAAARPSRIGYLV